MSTQHDPRKGQGWENFLDEDRPEIWYEAFQTDDEGLIDLEQYEHFDNIQQLVNFVAGTGSYSQTRSFAPGEPDIEDKKRQLHNDKWKIPAKMQQINEYLENEDRLAPNEIDLDPEAETELTVTETESHLDKYDTKYTAHFIAYNPDEENPDAQFYIQGSWYDTPPEQTNLEQIFGSLYDPEKHEK